VVDVARESGPVGPAREGTARQWRSGPSAATPGLSIVVPVHNEAASLPRLHAELAEVARTLNAKHGLACEVIYVDDGSRDDTLAIAHQLPATALDIQLLSLSRNFGKEAALLHRWLDDGYDVVYTAKAHRANESPVRRFLVKSFYLLVNWGAQTKIPEDAGDFRLLSPRATDALRQLPERNRFFKGLSSWIGFRQIRIDYYPAPRSDGRSTWSLRSLIGLSIDGLTAFSVAPLRVATWLGSLLALAAFIYGAQIIYETFAYGERVPGYPSLFVGVMVLGGVQLIMLGVVGEYIGKILYEIKGRPVYFVAEHAVKPREEQKQPEADTRTAAE
jgi:polyisoprenyl-phosphate glycosyltransferase